jgi:broad specificity phosphatase PhoE
VALLRHAVAPGTGDPAAFALRDCSTQRNLSEEGRAQAKRIGARFRANGIDNAMVFSSQWCRCLETAKLLGLGPVKELPALNSFFGRYERRGAQITAMKIWIARQELGARVLLVTHQVNITGLTNVFPASGELVIVSRAEDGSLRTLGTIETD